MNAKLKDCLSQLGFAKAWFLVVFAALNSPVAAQIVPDATLLNNSLVTPSGNTFTIDGGSAAAGNLFHSFGEFSLPTNTEVFFNNALSIENIIARVTGGKISHIDGLIRANGSANLFLINPSGIIFSPKAQLNIGGSFLASTASSIQFPDGRIFSAANPSTTPLLSVNVPVGLQYGSNPGSIQIDGSSLQVSAGKSIALLGGNTSMDGGQLVALGGRVELGGITETGTVGLSSDGTGVLNLTFPAGVQRGDVSIANRTLVDVTAGGGGSIAVNARNVDLSGRVFFTGGIGVDSGSVGAVAGDITIDATETVTFKDTSVLFNQVNSGGTGDAGNINIFAGSLYLINGSQLFNSTYGNGNSGRVNINVRDRISLEGLNPDGIASGAFSSVAPGGIGNGSGINITAGSLSIAGAAGLFASTFGTGNAGSVNINAREEVSVEGGDGKGHSSGVFSTVQQEGIGNGNTININAHKLSVRNGSVLTARTFGQGNGGNIIVNANTVDVASGGQILTTSYGIGKAGNIILNVIDRVNISGSNPLYFTWLAQYGQKEIDNVSPASGLFANTIETSTNQGGSLNVNAGHLIIEDGGQITVNSQGSGNAGILSINADSMVLENQAAIAATTASGEGGNITLQVRDLLLIRNGSQITTEAGGTGNGGNLTIHASILAALDNSDTIANAFQGSGGNIQINTQGIFGTQFRETLTTESDITASSQFGLSGTVTISNPQVDPASGLVELSQEVTDPSKEVIVGCAATSGNSFTITGRSGLPEDPTATISGRTIWQDLQNYSSQVEKAKPSPRNSQVREGDRTSPIVEATGWVKDEKGNVLLVAAVVNGTDSTYKSRLPQCQQLPSIKNVAKMK